MRVIPYLVYYNSESSGILVAQQAAALGAAARLYGIIVPPGIITDTDIDPTIPPFTRPGLLQVLQIAQMFGINAVAVGTLDRLAKNSTDFNTVIATLIPFNITIISASWDSLCSNPGAALAYTNGL